MRLKDTLPMTINFTIQNIILILLFLILPTVRASAQLIPLQDIQINMHIE